MTAAVCSARQFMMSQVIAVCKVHIAHVWGKCVLWPGWVVKASSIHHVQVWEQSSCCPLCRFHTQGKIPPYHCDVVVEDVLYAASVTFHQQMRGQSGPFELSKKETPLLGFLRQVGGVQGPCEIFTYVDSKEFDVIHPLHLFAI